MEGGQSTSINLEAPLDVSSSDMLVSVNSPTMQHNWQKYQGKCLPNSLRFEKNGWAAGWDVFDFDYNTLRIQYGSDWLGLTQRDSTPTYVLGYYRSEDAVNPYMTEVVLPECKIKQQSGTGEMTLVNNVLSGNVNDKTFSYTWNPTTETLEGTFADLTVECTAISDTDWAISIVDDSTKLSVNNNIYKASVLSGTGLSTTIPYSKYANGKHSWGDFTFDGTNVSFPHMKDSTATVTGNTVKFSGTAEFNENLNATLQVETLYKEFDDGVVYAQLQDTTDVWLTSDASQMLNFNKASVVMNPDDLVPFTSGVQVDARLPIWATVQFSQTEANTSKARKPDNVNWGNIKIAVPKDLIEKEAFVGFEGIATSVFEPRVKCSLATFTDDARYLTGAGMSYRYNKIWFKNCLGKSKDFNTQKSLVSSLVNIGASARFSGMVIADIDNCFGGLYTAGTCTYDPHTYITENLWCDASDLDNAFYTEEDIRGARSIKAVSEPDVFDTNKTDQDIVDANIPDEDTLYKQYVCALTQSPSSIGIYSNSDNVLELNDAYINGKYAGGTFEKVDISHESDETWWPFEYVPRFNYKDADGKIHTGVYAVAADKIVSKLEDFMTLIRGQYDESKSLNLDIITDNPLYNVQRVIYRFNPVFDFDLSDVNDGSAAEKTAWLDCWKTWYDTVQNPAELSTAAVMDDRYTDYANTIYASSLITPDITFSAPGVVVVTVKEKEYSVSVCTDWRSYAKQSYEGFVLYEKDTSKYEVKVFHNSKDASNEYDKHYVIYDGSLKLDAFTDIPWYDPDNMILVPVTNYFGDVQRVSGTVVEQSLGSYTIDSTSGTVNHGGFNVYATALNSNTLFVEIGTGNGYIEGANFVYGTDEYYKTHASVYAKKAYAQDGVTYWRWEPVKEYETRLRYESTGSDIQYVANIPECIVLASSCWGYISSILTYNDIYSKNNLLQKLDEAFTFKITETAQTGLLYIDRGDRLWFEQVMNGINLDDGNGNTVFSIAIRGVKGSDEGIYYAKKALDSSYNEIVRDYYYPDIAGDNGGMTSATSFNYRIKSIPVTFEKPKVLTVNYKSAYNVSPLPHTFFKDDKSLFLTVDATIDDLVDTNNNVNMYLKLGSSTVKLVYNTEAKTTKIEDTTVVTDFANADITIEPATFADVTFDIPMRVLVKFTNVSGKFIMTDPDTLIAYADDAVTCETGTGAVYVYDMLKQALSGLSAAITVTDNTDFVNVKFTNYAGLSGTVVFANALSNIYKGIDINSLLETDDAVYINSTDIRTPSKTKRIGKLNGGKEFQLVKQQWNSTVEVEEFWWVDAGHILELNDTSFVLKRKTGELDDWNGDCWEKIYEINKTGILDSTVRKRFVTNVYNTSKEAIFVIIKLQDDMTISFEFYNIRKSLSLIAKTSVTINRVSIGSILNTDNKRFNSYSKITAGELLSEAQWSNTMLDGCLIIGCHLNNNYNQWAIIFDVNTLQVSKIIQGYGCVGLNGTLTGGQIPDAYFDVSRGFSGTVEDFSVLNTGDIYEQESTARVNVVDEHVVGSAEKQYYISKTLSGIVSHLTCDSSGNYTKVLLPITNNFDAVYKSPSYYASVIGDLMIQPQAMAQLFEFPEALQAVWYAFMAIIGYPTIYLYAPRQAKFVYLQQTFGQYAYVHYNSSESPGVKRAEDENTSGKNGMDSSAVGSISPNLKDNITFDKQIFAQSAAINSDFYLFSQIMFSAFSSAVVHLGGQVSVNSETNQTATSDVGRKYTQLAMENLGALAISALGTEGQDVGLVNQVVGIKSLDMFYSTSDRQHVYAGPGFVEHQFTAQCVSQSTTNVNTEGNVMQLNFIVRALTTLQGYIAVMLEENAADGMDTLGESLGQQMVCGTSMAALGATMHTAATALRAILISTKQAWIELDKILDVMCQRGITSERVAQVKRSAITVEGSHKYGEKSETFMYPCWGATGIKYTDEHVKAVIKESTWNLNLAATKYWVALVSMFNVHDVGIGVGDRVRFSSITDVGERSTDSPYWNLRGKVPYYQASCMQSYDPIVDEKTLPDDMACIQGVSQFLPGVPFKNENIAVSDPAFAPSLFQDYIIDKRWQLSQTCTYGLCQWVTVKDTKITNCAPSNMIVTDSFCGIATSYSVVEVKRGLSKAYMRPWAITPNVLALNCTGYNSILDNQMYHAFDGISYRLVDWRGGTGMGKQLQSFLYSFQVNDRFKRSNKFPANEVQGCFDSVPVQALDTLDKVWSQISVAAKEKGMEGGTIGEDKDTTRWAVPVFTEPVTLLPAAVKTITAMPLIVYDGITSLCTDVGNNQTAYKAPLSVDFTIGKNVYRQTEDYICSVQTTEGLDIVTDLVPALGLKYIGATPTEAYFYSEATRCYYSFTGSTLVKMDMLERFRDIKSGHWDFVNQEVVMPCLMTFKRLNSEVEDTDTETDNIIVPVFSKNQVSGELTPPITTIFNDRSWYKVVSLPSGLAYQGPNRVIINRSVFVEYMTDSMRDNFGKWKRMSREKYTTKREYPETYSEVTKNVEGVEGWTHNPFLLVTSALGASEGIDCLYEWVITFCWPIEMDLLYDQDNFAVVNITAETMTPGGKVKSRPTHIYLTKELFTRTGNYGYYSFRYQSKNGAGNRERLHIWSDQYIAISSLACEYKQVTSRRNEQLTQQLDIQRLKEL